MKTVRTDSSVSGDTIGPAAKKDLKSTLSELENALYQRFLKEREIEPRDMNQKELGALGKLKSKELVMKKIVVVGQSYSGIRTKTIWKLKEID